VIDEEFVKAVESEYAIKYLEYLGIEPTKKNIRTILTMAPFKECHITPGWESSEEVPSAFLIYPPKRLRIHQTVTEAKGDENKKLPPIKEKVCMKAQGTKGEQEGMGVPKLTVDVIRRRYLYPFSIDSTFNQ